MARAKGKVEQEIPVARCPNAVEKHKWWGGRTVRCSKQPDGRGRYKLCPYLDPEIRGTARIDVVGQCLTYQRTA